VVTVEQNGKPVTDLVPYLGAASHVIVLDQNGGDFHHVHGMTGSNPPGDMAGMGDEEGSMAHTPATFGPTYSFSDRFDKPGLYKIWSQFAHGDAVTTVSWVVEVR
jgi:hypothetical protein